MYISSKTSNQYFFKVVSTGALCVSLLACGGGGGSTSEQAVGQQPIPSTPVAPVFKGELSLLAGNIGGAGELDGFGTDARFNAPQGIAFGPDGTLYVADTGNNSVRKIDPSGSVSTLTKVSRPLGVVVDNSGNTYVISVRPQTINGATYGSLYAVVKVSPEGLVTTLAQPYLYTIDPCRSNLCHYMPQLRGIAADREGNVYTTGSGQIAKITPSGQVSTLATLSKSATSIAIDGNSRVFALLEGTNEIVKVDQAGNVTPLEIQITDQETHSFLNFTISKNGDLYVLDRIGTDRARILKVEQSGLTTIVVSGKLKDTTGNPTDFSRFVGTAFSIDKNGNYFSTNGNTVQKMDSSGTVIPFAGKEGVFGYTDGIGENARFPANGAAVASDMDGNAYVTDPDQFTVRKITATGTVSTIAGAVGVQGTNNGKGEAAKFWLPKWIASNRNGGVYVSDLMYQYDVNNPPVTTVNDGSNLPITTIRNVTSLGDVATVADLMSITWDGPSGNVNPAVVTTDKAGNLYIAEVGWRNIKKISPDGTVSSAGGLREEWPGIGRGVVSYLRGMAADSNGSVFLLYEGHSYLGLGSVTSTRIEKVTSGNYPTHFVGKPTDVNAPNYPLEEPTFVDGKGSDARFSKTAKGITIDDVGNLYVADTGNHSIRKVTPEGMVSTLIGSKKGIRLGNSPSLDSPTGITYAAPNTLIITTPGSVLKFQ